MRSACEVMVLLGSSDSALNDHLDKLLLSMKTLLGDYKVDKLKRKLAEEGQQLALEHKQGSYKMANMPRAAMVSWRGASSSRAC